MAEKIEKLPEGSTGSHAVQEEWLDGSAWKLTQGEDYERSTSAMRAALSSAGRARGLRLRSRRGTGEDGREQLSVQFVAAEGDAPSETGAGQGGRRTRRPAATSQ